MALQGNLTAIADASNPNLITATQTSVNNILGLSSQSIQDAYTAQGQQIEQQGYNTEAQQYGAASQIADQNAALEQAYSGVQQYQQQIQAGQTIGTSIATRAANGFGNAGTPMMMLRSSLMQSALTRQLTGMQGQIQAGGFLEQAAASKGEQAAANTASAAAGVEATGATTAGQLAGASAATEANLLSKELDFSVTPAIGLGTSSPGLAGGTQGLGGSGLSASSGNSPSLLPTVIGSALNTLPPSTGATFSPSLQQAANGVGNAEQSMMTLFDTANAPLNIQGNGWPMLA